MIRSKNMRDIKRDTEYLYTSDNFFSSFNRIKRSCLMRLYYTVESIERHAHYK